VRSFSLKIQETCKLFLIVLEDYLRFTYWSDLYLEITNYTCFEIFKDYYEDANFYIDRNKLFRIEEDIWLDYSKNVIMIEENNNATMLNFDNYGFQCNFLTYDMDLDFNEGFEQINSPKEIVDVVNNAKSEDMSCTSEKAETVLTFKSKDTTKSKKQQPVLKDLIVKFTKRENVDKKILRKFRKFLKDLFKRNQLPPVSKFWSLFIVDNLLPPLKLDNDELLENVNFKSFNTTYMLWLFSHEGGVELYDLFYKHKSDQIFSMFLDLLGKSQQDEIELRNYIVNFAMIYSCKDNPMEDTMSVMALQTIPEEVTNPLDTSNDSFKCNKVYDVVFDPNKMRE
jgi:hypothetical protein